MKLAMLAVFLMAVGFAGVMICVFLEVPTEKNLGNDYGMLLILFQSTII